MNERLVETWTMIVFLTTFLSSIGLNLKDFIGRMRNKKRDRIIRPR
jgi:hypothetical protein